ncbi:MAG: hypothetical protein ACJ0F8_04165 [Gammaproteobacteria bacterium]|uniref:Uncharacterized protein n=1 Tax=SAR86 cluster bacterium TaxID=2030880 RepID=A0A520N1M3_9GAMM|nr:hypothetical protein [Gammaproteobacteria bacterium]RPG34910.1 MAG: hypothetical protein CBD53_001470 [Gammaproteobacteria bacterium TMED193]RZO27335.1 MAG: hypothetical protein EVA92_00905 [SAR86 cluster bacterium]|tara:strand:- start:384 stop:623 length:240 start_codon:yes stop_codon:yes gene_type:complete
MKFKDIIICLLVLVVAMLASVKTYLVFDYKRGFVYLSEIQKSIDLLKNENAKLSIELSLLKESPAAVSTIPREIENEKD